ncbi:MAG: hypothetical protein AB7H77_10980 [Bdellovibrionales bacterium]
MPVSAFRIALLFSAVLFSAPAAFALSIDKSYSADGEAIAEMKEPDAPKPSYLNPPADSSALNSSSGIRMPLSSNGHVGITVNRPKSPQPDAFDRAFSRFGN